MQSNQSLQEKFESFLKDHPAAYTIFCELVQEAINNGMTHYSSKGIIEVLRYKTYIDERTKGKRFKIDNSYSPYFSRKWLAENPQYPDFFFTRETKQAA